MVTGLIITPHNWDELGYTWLLNVTNHLANLATSKVKDQPVFALRVKGSNLLSITTGFKRGDPMKSFGLS